MSLSWRGKVSTTTKVVSKKIRSFAWPELRSGQVVQFRIVGIPRRLRAAITLRRLMLRDPLYKRLRRHDPTLNGALAKRRFAIGRSRRRVVTRWVPIAGIEFSLSMNLSTFDEVRSVQQWLVKVGESTNKIRRSGTSATVDARPVVRRMKVRFEEPGAMVAALAAEGPAKIPVINHKRQMVAIEFPAGEARGEHDKYLGFLEKQYGAVVVPDTKYAWEDSWGERGLPEFGDDVAAACELDEVLEHIRAREAWKRSRGKGVAIAIVDSGINGTHPAFPAARRIGSHAFNGEDAFVDPHGHGTMCAYIAGASPVEGKNSGVAPESQLISCRTALYSTEIIAVYDFLIQQRATLKIPIVASNSWGYRSGTEPIPEDDVIEALDDAAAAGIVLVFSAGNYHQLLPTRRECGPNSIWSPKSRSTLLAVSTCDLNHQMWDYSSRGPGQVISGSCNTKPDVTAPTPANGRVLFGDGPRVLVNGWGTSGAAPQVAGLAALLLALEPALSASQIFDIIRNSSRDLGHEPTCQGAGMIDCRAAVDMI